MKIILIDEEGKRVGAMSHESAERIARDAGKILMMVSEGVYKIVDYGKMRYTQQQKEKKHRESQRANKIKEIKFNLSTQQHDIDIKTQKLYELLKKGIKAKLCLVLKGRQQSFVKNGIEKINLIVEKIVSDGVGTVEKPPSCEGSVIIAYINPVRAALKKQA